MTPDLAARFSLQGRTALVTGASGALGARFAETLAGAGAAVALAARRTQAMEPLRDRLAAAGRAVAVLPMDVTDPASVAEGLAAAESALGPVDLLVNNSGVADPPPPSTSPTPTGPGSSPSTSTAPAASPSPSSAAWSR